MATIDPVEAAVSDNAVKLTWTFAGGDTLNPFKSPRFYDFNEWYVQVTGTFNSQSISLKGSIDGTNYAVLNDKNGNALSFSAAGLKSVRESVLAVQPAETGVTTGVVTLLMRRPRSGQAI